MYGEEARHQGSPTFAASTDCPAAIVRNPNTTVFGAPNSSRSSEVWVFPRVCKKQAKKGYQKGRYGKSGNLVGVRLRLLEHDDIGITRLSRGIVRGSDAVRLVEGGEFPSLLQPYTERPNDRIRSRRNNVDEGTGQRNDRSWRCYGRWCTRADAQRTRVCILHRQS